MTIKTTCSYRLAIDMQRHWREFEDGIILFNPENNDTVLFNLVLAPLKGAMTADSFNADDCLAQAVEAQHQLILDTLNSMEELGFIHRIVH